MTQGLTTQDGINYLDEERGATYTKCSACGSLFDFTRYPGNCTLWYSSRRADGTRREVCGPCHDGGGESKA